jgi:hypothetical protein
MAGFAGGISSGTKLLAVFYRDLLDWLIYPQRRRDSPEEGRQRVLQLEKARNQLTLT